MEGNVPYGKIAHPRALGALVRRRRREAGINQAEAAGLCGVGVRFLSELERGKPTVQLQQTLQVLHRMGLELWLLPRGEQPEDRR